VAGRNLRRGFWRLVALFWAAGAVALVWWSDEVRRWPLADVCVVELDPPYRECFTDEARELAGSESLSERLLGRFRSGWEGIDPERVVPRWQTERYRAALRSLAARQAGWALLCWGPFYLLVWAFSGFRAPDPPPRE
jgi:hypothetical protein